MLLPLLPELAPETILLELGDVELLVEVAQEVGLDDELADDGEEPGESQGSADQEQDHAQEGDARVQERQVAVHV